MSRLSSLRIVDPVLTNLAIGYTNADFIAEFLFPIAGVDKEAGHIPKFTKEAFKLYQTLRAIRAKSNRINPEGLDTIPVILDEHDLEYPIDYREEHEAAFPLQAHAVNTVTEGIQLQREKMAADLAQDPANYAANNRIALAGTDVFTNKANSTPIDVVDEGRESVRSAIGRYPNTLQMGASVFKALKNHPQILDRIKYTQRGIVTEDILAAIFDVEKVVVGKAVMSDDQGNMSDIWTNSMTLAYVPGLRPGQNRTALEPSYGYTLRRNGSCQIDTRMEDNKLEIIRSTDIFKTYLLGADAGYLISDAV